MISARQKTIILEYINMNTNYPQTTKRCPPVFEIPRDLC